METRKLRRRLELDSVDGSKNSFMLQLPDGAVDVIMAENFDGSNAKGFSSTRGGAWWCGDENDDATGCLGED